MIILKIIEIANNYNINNFKMLTEGGNPLNNIKNMIPEIKMVYTVQEVSKILGVNKNSVYSLINAGVIKTMKLGRQKITINSLIEFLENYDGYDLSDLSNIKCIYEYKNSIKS